MSAVQVQCVQLETLIRFPQRVTAYGCDILFSGSDLKCVVWQYQCRFRTHTFSIIVVPQKIDNCIEYIHEHYTIRLSLPEILSETHWRKLTLKGGYMRRRSATNRHFGIRCPVDPSACP